MRVALVHDWLTGMRGGEKVLLSLAHLFPDARIHTLLHVRGAAAPELEGRDVRTTFVQHLPAARRRYRHYLPLFPAAAATIDVRDCDLVISSSHCVAKAVRVSPGALHVCYCHTPMRYVWDRYDDYFGPGRVAAPARWAIEPVAEALRAWDVATAPRVHRFVANSAYVARRIRRYYGRSATVIPPPVDTDFFTPGMRRAPLRASHQQGLAPEWIGRQAIEETLRSARRTLDGISASTEASTEAHPLGEGRYDLVVSALVAYKRLELALAAYRGTGRPLKLVGSGPEAARLRALAPPEAEFLGQVDDATLRDLYRGCRAVLMPGVEDFGIVPLEAMACGRPAVVFGEGGGAETVTHGATGFVFHEPTAAGLRAAVDCLEGMRFNTATLRTRAEAHGRPVFESRIRALVDESVALWRARGDTHPKW